MKDFLDFLKERIKIEEDYSKGLFKIVKQVPLRENEKG